MAYAGAVKGTTPPMTANYLCATSSYNNCIWGYYNAYSKMSSFIFLEDDSEWHHYSISFTTNSNKIRIAMAGFNYANYPNGNNAGDCYFANLLITDSYGPSPFIAKSDPENFRSVSVDILAKVANTVSYINSNAAVNVNLGSYSASGGYATGDVLNDITNIIGSSYDDIILGNNEDNTLTGGDGDDTLTSWCRK